MAAIAASATARAAICASTVAYNYLLSKATYATISGTYSKAEWSTRYAKPCIVLQWCYSHNGGTVGIRTCLDGAAAGRTKARSVITARWVVVISTAIPRCPALITRNLYSARNSKRTTLRATGRRSASLIFRFRNGKIRLKSSLCIYALSS